jgi:serine/threonine-protein kinase RIO1
MCDSTVNFTDSKSSWNDIVLWKADWSEILTLWWKTWTVIIDVSSKVRCIWENWLEFDDTAAMRSFFKTWN